MLVFIFVVQRLVGGGLRSASSLGTWTVNLQVTRALLVTFQGLAIFFLAFSGLVFFYNNMSLLFIFFSDMETASRSHTAVGVAFLISTGLVNAMDHFFGSVRGSCRSGRHPIGPADRKHGRGAGLFWPSWAEHLDTYLMFAMALSGGIMMFRRHLGLEFKYLISSCHAAAAVAFAAAVMAKVYYRSARRNSG